MSGTITGKRERSYYPSKREAADARTKRERVSDKVAGLASDTIDEARLAVDQLAQTESPDARGKSLAFAVRWFCAEFRDTSGHRTLDEDVADFLAKMKTVRSWRMMRRATHYLKRFRAVFGTRKPADLSHEERAPHVSTLPNRWHRENVLRAFFTWLSDGHRRALAKSMAHHLGRPTTSSSSCPAHPSRGARQPR